MALERYFGRALKVQVSVSEILINVPKQCLDSFFVCRQTDRPILIAAVLVLFTKEGGSGNESNLGTESALNFIIVMELFFLNLCP